MAMNPMSIIQTMMSQKKVRMPRNFQVVQNLMQNNGNPQDLVNQIMSNISTIRGSSATMTMMYFQKNMLTLSLSKSKAKGKSITLKARTGRNTSTTDGFILWTNMIQTTRKYV